ncbi:DUF2789 domain-containing protein [Azospira restricta]|uniref:DUF2789 domain-containing protein n=1 Tax=Azospira restricta TaxID=404405 RepID=A0A974PXJ1_9RHOO|nr:DUF2789 domain-containing protein [Azospira restricta]QRJ62988.1 DUF2789 domain-containing protein [Azospira restricta]
MERPVHDLSHLFAQLGEASDEAAIARFIESHPLPGDMHLHEAPFWKPAQSRFLREAILDDADWAEVADELNRELHLRH